MMIFDSGESKYGSFLKHSGMKMTRMDIQFEERHVALRCDHEVVRVLGCWARLQVV